MESTSVTTEIEGRGRGVLVAEDDENVRSVEVQLLQNHGFKVIAAENAEEAVHLFDQHAGEIHLAILDALLPGMPGLELADYLRARNPELPVIFISGYVPSMLKQRTQGIDQRDIFSKPYEPEKLLRRIGEILPLRSEG